MLGRYSAAGGSGSQPSLLEIQAAADEASTSSQRLRRRARRLGFDISRLESERLDAQRRVGVALARLAVRRDPGGGGRASSGSSARRPGRRAPRPSASTAAIVTAESTAPATSPGSPTWSSGGPPRRSAPDKSPATTERERLDRGGPRPVVADGGPPRAAHVEEGPRPAPPGRLVLVAAQASATPARAAERRRRLVREGRAAEAAARPSPWCSARLGVGARAAEERAAVDHRDRGQGGVATRARLAEAAGSTTSSSARSTATRSPHPAEDPDRQLAERAWRSWGATSTGWWREYGPENLVPAPRRVEDGVCRTRRRTSARSSSGGSARPSARWPSWAR